MEQWKMSWVLPLLALSLASDARAQDEMECLDEETVVTCFARVQGALAQRLSQQTAKLKEGQGDERSARGKIGNEVTKKATSEDSSGAASSMRNFLPVFLGTLGLGDVKDDGEAITLTFAPKWSEVPASRLIAQFEFRDPDLFEPLRQAIPVGGLDAFEDQLEDFDDIRSELVWTLESEKWGRNFQTQQRLFGDVFSSLVDPALGQRQRLVDLLQERDDLAVSSFGRMRRDNPDEARALEQVIIGGAAEAMEQHVALLERAKETGFFDIDDLANNQPQLFFTASYRARDELVGADEWSAKLTYEKGFANLNGLRKYCKKVHGLESPSPTCLQEYFDKKGKLKNIAPRVGFSAEFSEMESYSFQSPADMIDVQLDSIERRSVSFVYGTYLGMNKEGVQARRLDIDLSYKDFSDDAMFNNRFVATASVTQKVGEGPGLILGLVYANEPEFVGEVDEKLSARLGLTFKVDRKETATP